MNTIEIPLEPTAEIILALEKALDDWVEEKPGTDTNFIYQAIIEVVQNNPDITKPYYKR